MKKRLLTGLQPSGDLHIGNYFGALKPFVDMYEDYESFLMLANYHTLTSSQDSEKLRNNTFNLVRAYIAAGVDTQKVVIFKQSDVSEHTELAWIFNCLVTVPFLMQAHAYKNKVAKGLEANAGLFTYPMLMASDILLYDAEVVPVGEDQKQHVEYAREAATKFRNAYSDLFKEPEERIIESVGVVPGTDGQKMSKSYGNTIPLFASKDEIAKAVMGIVTDSVGDIPENVYAIHALYRSHDDLTAIYEEHKGNYKNLKEALIEDIETHIAPMREQYNSLTEEDIKNVLEEGAEKARIIANAKMQEVREVVGVNL